MIQPQNRLLGMVVEDNDGWRYLWGKIADRELDAGIAHMASNNSSALEFMARIVLSAGPLDFVVTDLGRAGGSGVELIRSIRSLPPTDVVSGCLRARHIPIVVCSGAPYEHRDEIAKIDSTINVLNKMGNDSKDLARAIVRSVADYRHRALSQFHKLGLAIYWHGGQYRVGSALDLPSHIESEYIAGSVNSATAGYSRLFLLNSHLSRANLAIESFEKMLNCSRTREKDFQNFFERHPEFLLGDQYDSYWAEPRLKSPATGKGIRPDFVLQPADGRTNSWNWQVVDLKSHNVDLLSHRSFHVDLSRHVYRVMAQLRDYQEFFEDPRNHDLLVQKFGGVRPEPRLTAIIGRLPTNEKELFARLQRRAGQVRIRTYDEVLEIRRAKVDRFISYKQ